MASLSLTNHLNTNFDLKIEADWNFWLWHGSKGMMGWLGVIALDCNDWWKGLGDYLQAYNTSPALWLALCKLIITAKATFTYPSAHQRSLDLLLVLPRWPCPPLACCRYQCWGGYILRERVGQTTTLGILTIPFLLTSNVQVVLHHIGFEGLWGRAGVILS